MPDRPNYYAFPQTSYGSPSATSTGPYPVGAPLASSFQQQTFDIQNQDRVGQISDLVNSINRNAQQTALSARVPNNPALEAQSSSNIGSELGGQVPQDVMNLLGQQAAERGVATGDIGGPNANAAYLRALGLTSLGQQQLGQQNLTAADQRNPAAPIFDPTTQLLTPSQGEAAGLNLGQQNLQAYQDLLQNQLAQQGLAAQQNQWAQTNQLNQQKLASAQQAYANPSLNYGGLTGQDLFGPDATQTGSGGYTLDQSPQTPLSNAYDFSPTTGFPSDYGSPLDNSSDYATTPISAYG